MKIFVAISQYKIMKEERVKELAQEIGIKKFKAYSLEFHPMFENSLVEMVEQNPHHQFLFQRILGSTLDRSRSMLLGIWKKLYDEGDCYDYFFILDEDISFPPEAIDMMIKANQPVIGGAYSFKTDKGPKANMPVCKFLSGEKVRKDGTLKIKRLNGGFIFIRSDALLKMIETYPELYWDRFPELEGDGIDIRGSWALWIADVCREYGIREYLSEDYAFCERARKVGYEIWCHTKIPLLHWEGPIPYAIDWRRVIKKEKPDRPIDNEIDGWTTPLELEWLEDRAKEMKSVVEIGCWKGRSSKMLLRGCPGKVWCVDHFQGSPGTQFSSRDRAEKENIYQQFIENVGLYPNLEIMKMSSEDATEMFATTADMIFIDGDHSYKAVKRDLQLWLPKCKKLICGHDYNEVWRAVHDVLGKITGIYEGIWYKEISND
jgi:hypothetical protein